MTSVGPRFSVVVPVFNDTEGLLVCLEALELQTFPKDRFEVIVVDNGSAHPLPRPDTSLRLMIIFESRPGSYAARNAGVRRSRGELLAFTDADCQPAHDWLEQLDLLFDEDKSVMAIGGRIEVTISGERRPAELYELALTPFPQSRMVETGRYAATANLTVRRSAFQSVGEFDSELLSSGDREWGNRLVAQDLVLRYSSRPVVMHPARKSIRDLVKKRRRIAGGMIRYPGRSGVSRTSDHNGRIHDPRHVIAASLLFAPARFGLSRGDGAKAFCVAVLLVLVRIAEQIRVILGGAPVR